MASFVNATGEVTDGAILGMGNPLLDISAEVGDEILEKYDVKLNNAILAEDKHLPIYEELKTNFQASGPTWELKYHVEYIAGGATQNSIRVAQWMLGVAKATSFMGCIGSDEFGAQLTEAAAKDGVDTHYQVTPGRPTGTCAVLVKGGERSLVANLAAANHFVPAHLDTDKAKAMVEQSRVIYIAGFFLTVSLDSILTVGNHAVDNGKIFCMNLSAPFIVQFFGDQLAAALMYCDFVFGNESEAAALGEAKEWGADLKQVALRVAALPKASGTRPRVVVFTQGAESTIVACGGTVTEYAVERLPQEALVDTNGAGDAFVGSWRSCCGGLGEKRDRGHWASRVVIQRSGCTFPETCDYQK
ncbi:unnamed protein product [Heterosigma akashiwo]